MPFASIEDAIQDIRQGRFVVVVDDENRENEGDLVIAAEFATPEAVNFMITHGRGLVCAPLTRAHFQKLGIPLMVPSTRNNSRYGTRFGISVGASKGITTGISAADRAYTIGVLVNEESSAGDLTMPGHIFPLEAVENGVLKRRGHTEACVDLAKLAGLKPAGAICEILNEDGTMARLPQLRDFAKKHDLKIISIEDLVAYRRHKESLVSRIEATILPTSHGHFKAFAYRDHHGLEHLALCLGDFQEKNVLVRLHSSCLTGDVFGSNRCDCGQQLEMAMDQVTKAGRGIILYLSQEGRGIGLANKIRAYALQDRGLDTVEANLHLGFPDDARTYDVGAAMLKDLDVNSVHLMTNNPNKIRELEACGIRVEKRIPVKAPHPTNINYLRTKEEKMGHLMGFDGNQDPAEVK